MRHIIGKPVGWDAKSGRHLIDETRQAACTDVGFVSGQGAMP